MVRSVMTSLALAGVSALATGSAIVINKCNYDVHLCNVPSDDGVHKQQDEVLSSGDRWSQNWTELDNKMGWSIKLSKSSSLANIMQYEYTFHDDGIIWFDLSDVNGNPWNNDWEIDASNPECKPKQQAYRYATDDAYGMQSCDDATDITVTLCSGESQDDSDASSVSSSVAAASTSHAQSTFSTHPQSAASSEATESPASSSQWSQWNHQQGQTSYQNYHENYAASPSSTSVVKPTTFATSTTSPVEEAPGVTVFQVETAVVTDVVTAVQTADAPQVKRHEHHAHHHHA